MSEPASKKRVAEKQLIKDQADQDDEEEGSTEQSGFKVAAPEELAKRKMVKVRRNNAPTSTEESGNAAPAGPKPVFNFALPPLPSAFAPGSNSFFSAPTTTTTTPATTDNKTTTPVKSDSNDNKTAATPGSSSKPAPIASLKWPPPASPALSSDPASTSTSTTTPTTTTSSSTGEFKLNWNFAGPNDPNPLKTTAFGQLEVPKESSKTEHSLPPLSALPSAGGPSLFDKAASPRDPAKNSSDNKDNSSTTTTTTTTTSTTSSTTPNTSTTKTNASPFGASPVFNFGTNPFMPNLTAGNPFLAANTAAPSKKGEDDEEGGDEDGAEGVEEEKPVDVTGFMDPSVVKEREKLQKEPQKSGEEGEKTVFQEAAKFYTFDAAAKKWADRGKGTFKVNVADDKKTSRMLMRADKTMRLWINARLTPALNVEKSGDKAIRFMVPNPDTPSTLDNCTVRFGTAETATKALSALIEQKNQSE